MNLASTPELYWLTLTVLLTALLSFPYVSEILATHGPRKAIGDGGCPPANSAGWAQRARRAHANAVENLVLFAPIVLIIVLLNQGNKTTALACEVYFFARLSHYIVYLLGIPYVRTFMFAVGLTAQLTLIIRLFGW